MSEAVKPIYTITIDGVLVPRRSITLIDVLKLCRDYISDSATVDVISSRTVGSQVSIGNIDTEVIVTRIL